jgi:hypothetical protein
LEIVSHNRKWFCNEDQKRHTQRLTIHKQMLRQKCVTRQLLPIWKPKC